MFEQLFFFLNNFSISIVLRNESCFFTLLPHPVAALLLLLLTSQRCFLVSQLVRFASAGLLFPANTSLLFGSGFT